MESSAKAGKSFWEKPWVIPTTTAISTALLSGLISWKVMDYQLSSEHSFASQQKSEERHQKLIDEKMRLTSEAARLSGELLGIRLQYAMDTYLTNSLSIVMMGKTGKTPILSAEDLKSASTDYDHAQNVQHEDFTRLYSIGAQTQSIFKISSIRFGSKTKEAIERLAPTTPPLGTRVTPETSLLEEATQFESQVKNEEEYRNSVYQVLDTMASEVAAEFTNPRTDICGGPLVIQMFRCWESPAGGDSSRLAGRSWRA